MALTKLRKRIEVARKERFQIRKVQNSIRKASIVAALQERRVQSIILAREKEKLRKEATLRKFKQGLSIGKVEMVKRDLQRAFPKSSGKKRNKQRVIDPFAGFGI